MSRLQSVRENWTEITELLKSDKQHLAQFLRFQASMYKMSFPDAALIYQQSPNATKVAELSTWNKLGRLVNKGERSIAVFGEDNKCKYLFDISQTNGKRVPELWKLSEDISADLTSVINEKYGKSCKSIQETIAAMAVDNIKTRLPDIEHNVALSKLSENEIKAYQQSVVSAVRFVVSNRCELGSDMKVSTGINLNAVDSFKDNRDLIRFCDLVQKSAKDTLLEMEREIVQIYTKRREQNHDLQTNIDRTVKPTNTVHGRSERTGTSVKSDSEVGKTVAGMGTDRVPDGSGSLHNGGQVADNSEGDRRSGRGTLSGTRHTIPSKQPSTDGIQRNTGLGEKQTSLDRTSDYGGDSLSVEGLIKAYKNADFNRRLDNYETAGKLFYDLQGSNIDPIEFFDKFDAEKFSVIQADEIRNIIESAVKNQPVVVEEIPKLEPVIILNEIVETTELPSSENQKRIAAIMKNDEHFNVSREDIAEYFNENQDIQKRTDYIKSVFNTEYDEVNVDNIQVGFKVNESGLYTWEGDYLNRSKKAAFSWDVVQAVTADMIDKNEYLDIPPEKILLDIPHDKNGYYADDLDDGDIIELSDETWTVASKKAYSIKLVNKNENADEKQRYYFGKWQDRIAELGFELISENGYSQEHDDNIEPHIEEKVTETEPIFTEPKKIEPVIFEPDTQGDQLSFFGDDEPAKTVIPNKRLDLPSYEITQDMIDYALRCGSNEPKTMERITAQYQKGKSEIENAEFLRNEFGVDGRGYLYTNPDTNKIQTMSAWFDKDGITLGAGNTAFNTNSNTHISWEQVSSRISEMYENGEYTSQDNIDRAAQYEMRTIAENLWYLHQDCEAEYFIPDEMFKGGFPDSTQRITASLTDKNTVQKYIDGLTDLTKKYEENRNILRYHFHKPKALLEKLKDLQLERKDFITKSDFSFNPKYFITEDEKDKVVSHGGNIQDSKFRIAQYFNQEHSAKEKADFLKNGYGTGGTGRTGFNIWHDSAGLVYSKGESLSKPDCSITMKWNEVASRVERLISEGKYITQKDIDERIRHAKYTINNTKPTDDVNKVMIKNAQKVLDEYGISNEPQKSPMQKIIEKAQAAGIPVEVMETPQEIDIDENDKAVFMDTRDESFISVMQTDEGIDYTMYAPDLTPIDSGVWEMDEYVDLEFAASELLGTSEKMIAEAPDYDKFIELADMNTDLNVPSELSKMKADILANIPDEKPVKSVLLKAEHSVEQKQEHKQEQPKVDTPEKISAVKFEKKTGTPVTYHFNENNLVSGGVKSKFNANVEAIKTLQKLETENRYATPEEQAIMAKYVGWGGISQAFTTDRAAESLGGNVGNSAPTGWENEQKELLSLLSVDEYKAARASTLTSFYTPPEVTDGVYQALSQFGFEGGNVLEPSMGVGNFFAKMPEDIHDNSRLYGVELDSVSGRIAQQLYPQERIQIKGFEQTSFNNNSFDVVVGNIPFGDYRVSDKAYDKHNFKIHDYFAAKAVDKVKPGGVVALVTSKFTMDKHNEKARRYLAERCDLLGAVRLPNDAFKKNAGTEVTTDILFLKKRETLTVEVPDWVHMSQTDDGIPCNKYFVDNPDMVLGKMAWDERMQGKYGADSKVTTCIADDSISLAEQIKKAVSKIEGSIETIRADEKEKGEQQFIPADPSVRNFTHTIVDGDLYFRENEVMLKVQETGKTLDRMMGLHKIRQAAMAVIDGQAEGCSDIELSALQNELNSVYDKFKKAYGNITDTMNERCFRSDDDYNTLAALEIVNTEKKTVEKAEIFSKRTIQPIQEITSVDTPQEALQVSIDRVGKVDIEYMAQLVGCEPEKIVADLGNEIFRNPAKIHENEKYSGYEDASEYLSGNVREKLKIAKDYAKHIDSDFEKNISALERVIPKDLEASEISVRIGANWIDIDDYNAFLKEFAKADTYAHPVTRTKMGEYKIEGKYQDKRVSATETHGTSRMSSYHIFENLLNQRDVVIRDRREEDGKVWYEVNAKETQLAKEKARQMKDGFKSWIFETVERREKYVEKYNYLFNAIRGREYDGSRQTFPGMNPAIKLNPHQENAVLRGKLGGNTLLAHCVGAGKSFEMIATSMEKKRLGLINKACVVVPKHLTLQTASEWMRLYPNAKLLVARPEDFTKDNRQKFIARCVTGDYDAVVMSFTQFERIPMSDQYRKQFMERELNEIMDALEEVDSTDRVSVKALERQKRQVEERLEKLLSSPKDNSLCFEKLGFDYLVCDEAHNFKNCFVSTKMSNVAGVQTTAAQKSEDMLMKTQYLNDKYGCNNILFATGTPNATPYQRLSCIYSPIKDLYFYRGFCFKY